MTLHEEITALLQGDVTDQERVAELMHVLAVSPEKRSIFIEQIQLSRALTSLAGSVTPPRKADQAIWQGLAAIDAAIAGTAPDASPAPAEPPSTPAAKPGFGSRGGAAAASILLMALLFSVTYLFQSGNATSDRNGAGMRDQRDAHRMAAADETTLGSAFMATEAAHLQSLTDLRSQLSELAARNQGLQHQMEVLRSRGTSVRVVYRDRPVTNRVDLRDTNGNAPRLQTTQPANPQQLQSEPQIPNGTSIAIASVEPRMSHGGTQHPVDGAAPLEEAKPLAMNASSPLDEDAPTAIGPWQVGVRDQFRLSLPRVYGLAGNRTILFDKELSVSYQFGGGNSLLSAMRLSLAAGETQFSQIYHTNVGGQVQDSIVLQSPSLQYGRLVIAPELVRTTSLTGALELGAGLATSQWRPVGPIASFGVNLEYRPIDRFSINLGSSAWMLWSQHATSTIVSTNLNAHLGFAVGF